MKIASTKERILQYIDFKRINISSFLLETGIKRGFLDSDKLSQAVSDKNIAIIIATYPEINLKWLITGDEEMLKEDNKLIKRHKKLIPLYNDISHFFSQNLEKDNSHSSNLIDMGDWFGDATAAIRHYGEAMMEYPSGCILAIKEINNKNLIMWGSNYFIKTDEYSFIKRLQKGDNESHIKGYSTNEEKYTDGKLIHETIEIPVNSIKNIALVLGCVVNQYTPYIPTYNIKK